MLKKLHHLKRFLPEKEASLGKKILFWLVAGGATIFIGGAILLGLLIIILSFGLPNVNDLENLTAAQSTEIYDRNGKLIYTIHGEENREVVALEDIAPELIEATIALEDDQFYDHPGFDIWAIGRAGLHSLTGIGSARGGSTLTQQYVKNTFLSSERTYTRKLKELILALRLEKARTKDEILALYLNRIPYGNNAYGIQKASEVYFSKDASDLTLPESAILASLPQAPSRYNPYGDNRYSRLLRDFTAEELEDRKIESELDLKTDEYVRGLIGKHYILADDTILYIPGRTDHALRRMEEMGKITQEERQKALNDIKTIEFKYSGQSFKHQHFIEYIKKDLEDKYSKDIVETGGLKVYTTLDIELQEFAEEAVKKQGEINEKQYGTTNAAVLTVNAKTGEILAMVGSRQYDNEEIDGNVNVVTRPRQPGSSFKPFVYAQAFYNGYAPSSVIYDIPTSFGPYKPKNYDGGYRGQMTLRSALGQSRNIPAVKAYFLAGQQDPIITLVEKMGITSLKKTTSYGPSLALGSGEVTLMEMVTGYATFANNGKKPTLTAITKVENHNGDILEEWKPQQFPEVIDPQIAYLINDILSDQSAGLGPKIFVAGKINAAKTGTSTKASKQGATTQVRPADAWALGYTPTIVTGVWTGNADGTGLGYNADGYTTAAPIFKEVMTKALEGKPSEPFPEPKGIQKVKISKASGKLPGKNTPEDQIVTGIFASFAVPKERENNFVEVEIDKISGLLATEYTPEGARETVVYQTLEPIADMFNWKNELYAYYANRKPEEGEAASPFIIGLPPTEKSTTHSAQTAMLAPEIKISSPSTQGTVSPGNLEVAVNIIAPHEVQMVEFYVDGDKKFFTDQAPYTGYVNISRFLEQNSKHLIVAKVIDKLGYVSESVIEVRVSSEADETTEEEEDDE